MRVCIHRGTKEIGGTCIEIEASDKRIVLDVGLPLDADGNDDPISLLPQISGFREYDPTLLALIISHPHQDHYGLANLVHKDVPVVIGRASHNILQVAQSFTPSGASFEDTIEMHDRQPIEIGPFTITPFLVDHSAYDAYAVLVGAGGKKLFYSGDFRAHGRKAKLFEQLVGEATKDFAVRVGHSFASIISTLDELGYDLQWQVLNSKNYDVPQNRERVFIIGHLRGTPRPEIFPFTEESGPDCQIIGRATGINGHDYLKRIYSPLGSSPTLPTGTGGNHAGKFEIDERVRRLKPIECERLQGFPDNWTDGISDTQRFKCLGNAVTVNVIQAIISRMLDVHPMLQVLSDAHWPAGVKRV